MSALNRAKRILLLGYYGFGNAGDEAVLAGLIRSLQDEAKTTAMQIEVAALSISPISTAQDHGIKAFHRYKPGGLISALNWCDLLAAGGGSLLQDVTSARSIYYYLGVVRLAQLMGKKTMFIAQGIGPLNKTGSRNYTASVAKRCNAITVRNQGSADLLQELGVKSPAITVTADPALILGSISIQNTAEQAQDVLVSLRPWDGQDKLISTLSMAIKEAGIDPSCLRSLACANEDAPVLEALSESISIVDAGQVSAQALTFSKILEMMPHAKMVTGMRLHSLILASACGVPCVALSYDPKVQAFMEQSGQGDAVFDIRESDPSKLAAIIKTVLSETDHRREALHTALPQLLAGAQKNASVALSLF